MRLVISNDRVATGNVVRIALLEQCGGRPAIIPPRPRAPQGHPHVQGIDHQLPLAPLHLLAALIAALGTAPLRRVDRRASEARGTGRGLPTRGPVGLFAPCRQQLDPRARGAPPRQVVVPRTLGQSIVWEHRPLTPASIQIQERLPHFAPVDCSWVAPTLGGGRWKQRCQNRPLGVRQRCGLWFPGRLVREHRGARLDQYGERPLAYKPCGWASCVSG